MSELKTGTAAFLSREYSWMFSSLRWCFQPFRRSGGGKPTAGFESRSHLSLAYWCLPLGREGLMTAWKHFQMFPALNTQNRLPESLVWLHIDHGIVTNDSSGLEVFFLQCLLWIESSWIWFMWVSFPYQDRFSTALIWRLCGAMCSRSQSSLCVCVLVCSLMTVCWFDHYLIGPEAVLCCGNQGVKVLLVSMVQLASAVIKSLLYLYPNTAIQK